MLAKEKASTAGKSSNNCTDTGCLGRIQNSSCWEQKAGQTLEMDVVQYSRTSRVVVSLLVISVKCRKWRATHLSLSLYLADVKLSYPDVL